MAIVSAAAAIATFLGRSCISPAALADMEADHPDHKVVEGAVCRSCASADLSEDDSASTTLTPICVAPTGAASTTGPVSIVGACAADCSVLFEALAELGASETPLPSDESAAADDEGAVCFAFTVDAAPEFTVAPGAGETTGALAGDGAATGAATGVLGEGAVCGSVAGDGWVSGVCGATGTIRSDVGSR